MDKALLYERLGSWIQWQYGDTEGRAFVAVTAPTQLPAAVAPWATQHRGAVWQLIWLNSDAVLCGLAPTISPEQFAIVQHPNESVTTEATFAYRPDGSWRRVA
jgi:hypothetical protein